MTPTHAAAVLRQLTDWRRGVAVDPPNPGEVLEAIDAAIAMIDRLESAEKERELWTVIRDGMITPGHLAVGESVPMVENTSRLVAVERERDELRAELETERMRLAACGVVALANTPDSAKQAREMRPEYWPASCGDVARMVDENTKLRAKIQALEKQEPAGYGVLYVEPANGEEDWDSIWKHRVFAEDHVKDFVQAYSDLGESVGAITVVPLYALPGAKGEKK